MGIAKVMGIMWTKMSLVAVTGYFVYLAHYPINRFMKNVMLHDVEVVQGDYKDPFGLCIDAVINSNGVKEVYMIHKPSGSKERVKEDMGLETTSMLEKVLGRAENMSSDEIKEYLPKLNQIEDVMYRRLN